MIEVKELTTEQHAEIEALAARCRQGDGLELDARHGLPQSVTLAQRCRHDEGLELPLYLEPAGEQVCQILHYEAGQLVGIVTPGPEEPSEVLVLVHPQYRRRGVGRRLLDAARAECRRRGAESCLLVCEEASVSGKAFAEAMGATYRFSEYCMELDSASGPVPVRPAEALTVEPAFMADIQTLARIQSAAFRDAEEVCRKILLERFSQPEQRFYIGRRAQEAVGSLRVGGNAVTSVVYINSFGVLPEFQRRGYGRQILMWTIESLRAEGWRHIRIEVETDNHNALALYLGCGFREVTAYRYYDLPV